MLRDKSKSSQSWFDNFLDLKLREYISDSDQCYIIDYLKLSC